MQRCAFTPYEGKKPYIFISYAHKDSDRVFPILEELDRRGYRVWYDDGIAPGSEWPENIAQHLSDCSLTMAFVSPNSIASDNCRREVTFALSKRKPFLGIILQPTEMSLGMEMQLSAQQCIMKYTYTSDDMFYQKVCSCPDLAPCLGQPKPVAVPVVPAVSTAPAPAPVVQPKAAPAERKPLDKKMLGIIGGVAAAVVVLCLVIGIALSGGNKPDDSLDGTGGSQQNSAGTGESDATKPDDTFTDEVALNYDNQVITAEDAAYISKQSKLGQLEMKNCVIQSGAFDELDLPASLTQVHLINCSGGGDLTSLADLEGLVSLKLTNCELTDAMLPDRLGAKLSHADLSGNPKFSKLSMFSECTGLSELYFTDTAVSSVDCLSDLEELRYVSGSGTKVTNLAPLGNLTKLKGLYFADCGIHSIDTVFSALRLEELDLSGNQLEMLEAFENCTTLRKVDLSFNDLLNIDLLEKSAGSLESLNVSANGSLYEWDLEFLSGCLALRELRIDGLYLGTLSFIRDLTELDKLSAVSCSLKDVEDLQKLTKLTYLNLSFNDITDISPLSGLVNHYLIVDLSFNDDLTDISALPSANNYTVLNLTGGGLDPYTIPPVYGNTLVLAYHDALTDPSCMDESNRSIFGCIAVVMCPADKIVAMEDRFGEERVQFCQDEVEYLNYLEELGIDCSFLLSTIQY